MPWKISEKDGKYLVIKEDDGEVVGAHASRAKAEAQLRVLYASENKSLDLSYLKAVGASLDHAAVKSLGRDEIQGYAVLWGDPQRVDIEREFFTPETDFWDNVIGLKTPRPLTWDHAMDPKVPTVIGRINDMGDDEIGRWYTAQLDHSHAYRKAIDRLIEKGVLGTSSDSAAQYVIREKTKSGATWLKRWPLFAAALTSTPCEPRMLSTVEYLKSIGAVIPDAVAQPEADQAAARKGMNVDIARIHLLRLYTGD
jgi:hypothetical protein